jgi:anti-anti-sigma regulatory factor
MELTQENNIITIKGDITTVVDFDIIKDTLEETKSNYKEIILKIHDSLVINSSLIGYLVKIINQDGIRVSLFAGNETLFELLDDLGLAQSLDLQQI